MAEHLHSSFIPGCFRCAIGLNEVGPDVRISIRRKDLQTLEAALEDREQLRDALITYGDHIHPRCPALNAGLCDCGWTVEVAALEGRDG